jgi:phenylacetate-coenzyme A ligase PaaK-like adenylate-forming protein
MYAPLLRQVLFIDRQREVARRARLYDMTQDRADIERHQVERFNALWRYCLEQVPFYRQWAVEHDLPRQITGVSDLRHFPLLTKQVMVEQAEEIFQRGAIADAYSTGGTTGTPVRYPRGAHEALSNYADVYLTRRWWGIRPFDSYVHLWGHSHIFGGGVAGAGRRVKRAVADRLVNARRLNAYDMTEDAIEGHYRSLVRSNPVYLVGYTSAIFKLARYMEDHGLDLRALRRLRRVVVTAETVSRADADLITAVFGAPVVTEYGAAETGLMAASVGGTWPLKVLWASVILQADRGDLSVTTLNDRLFPLINYAIGDRAEPGDVENGNALTVASVIGRGQDVIRVVTTDGRRLELSAILPVHILKSQPGITTVQFRQEAERLRIFVCASHPVDVTDLKDRFARDLRRDHPTFDRDSVDLEQVAAPLLTRAGKHALFVPSGR